MKSDQRMIRTAPITFILVVGIFAGASVRGALPDLEADPMGPKLARGLSTQLGAFQVDEIDSINLMNGNLTLAIPLGQGYPAGGTLSYQLVAYYNSNDSTVRYREDKLQPHGDRLIEVAIPDVLSSAGRGWSVHLGMLFEGIRWREWQEISRLDRDKLPMLGDFADSFLYVSPDGSRSYLHGSLHGEPPQPGVFYSRDGSYLRLQLLTPAAGAPKCTAAPGLLRCAIIEMPDGEVHRFEKRADWPDPRHPRDAWRLVEIHDRPTVGNSGNAILIRYLATSWEIVDKYGRVQRVFIEEDPWFGRRTKRVEVTASAGRTAIYTFQYVPTFFEHVDGSPSGTVQTFEVGQLVAIELPPHRNFAGSDHPSYRFWYSPGGPAATGDTYIEKAELATGGTIEWEYGNLFLPSVELCEQSLSEGGSSVQNAVSMRTVRNPNGAVLKTTKYLRALDASVRVPSNFCNSAGSGSIYEPDAELVTGVLQRVDATRSRLELSYFSAWPYPRLETFQNGDIGGWGSEEYGRPITRDISLDNDDRRYLSTRTYDCPFASATVGENPETLSASCTLLRSTFLGHVQDSADCRSGSTWRCRGVNRHLREQVTVYHDDAGRRTSDVLSASDGFGHFRTRVTDGDISSADWREASTSYNAGQGELRFDGQGFTDLSQSTWVNLPRTAPWILTRFDSSTISFKDEAGTKISERRLVCYHPGSPLAHRTRRRVVAGADSPNDVVQVYAYNGSGLPDEVKLFGGDAPQQALPTGQGCKHAFGQSMTPAYHVLRTFSKGVLQDERLAGSTTTLADYQIDHNTSAVVRSTDATGLVVETYQYNQLGWVTFVSRNVGADTAVVYSLPGLNSHGATSEPSVVVRAQASVGGTATVLDRTRTDFDAMGRTTRVFSYHPEAGDLKTVRVYNHDGRLAYETTPHLSGVQATPSMRTSYSYDALGRVTAVATADGWTASKRYKGIRQVIDERSVGTGDNASSITYEVAATTTRFDRYGNLVEVVTPANRTTFVYDARSRVRSAQRGGQTRLFVFDGRGFLIAERHPEVGLFGNGWTTYESFDVAGNFGRKSIENRIVLDYQYDFEGRLLNVTDTDQRLLLDNQYGVSGTGNGRIVSSTRYNHLDVENTGGAIRLLGTDEETYRVRLDQTYHALGGPLTRTSTVTSSTGFSVASFDQSWSYDLLGRIETISYPRCTRPGCAGTGDEERTVTLTYARGAGQTLAGIVTPETLGVTLTYHDNGQLESYAHDNGRVDWFGIGPSFLPRISSISLASNAAMGPAFLELGAFRYDGAANVVEIGADRFLYDLASRLVIADVPGNPARRSYTYDQHDNLLRKDGGDIDGGGYDIPTDAATNRLAGTSAFDIGYDAAGNLTLVGQPTSFHYGFHYDDLGKQQAMVVNLGGSEEPCAPGGTGECFLYWYGPDEERLVTISIGANGGYSWTLRDLDGRVIRTYTEVNELTNQEHDFVYAGRTLVSSKNVRTDSIFHYHADHLGSTRVKTTAEGGLFGISHFQAYGGDATANGAAERISDWAGYEEDTNAITHNLRARVYFNTWGKFFSPDPARDGWNLYTYAANNPITNFDPTGLACNQIAPGDGTADDDKDPPEPSERCDLLRIPSDAVVLPALSPEEELVASMAQAVLAYLSGDSGQAFAELGHAELVFERMLEHAGVLPNNETPLGPGSRFTTRDLRNEIIVLGATQGTGSALGLSSRAARAGYRFKAIGAGRNRLAFKRLGDWSRLEQAKAQVGLFGKGWNAEALRVFSGARYTRSEQASYVSGRVLGEVARQLRIFRILDRVF